MITFRKSGHSRNTGAEIIEILLDGNFVGAIYPTDRGLRLISAHIENDLVVYDKEPEDVVPIPQVIINFDPKPYTIENGKLVLLDQ